MLNRKYPTVYNKAPTQEILWKIQGYVLFARLKNHTIVFLKARKEKTATQNSAKYVDVKKIGNITKIILKNVLLNMKDGLIVIQIKFSRTKELIITVIKNVFWKKCENPEKKMDIEIQKPIVKGIDKKLIATTLLLWLLSWDKSKNLISAKNVKTIVRHKLIIMIIQSLWMSFGFVASVMEKSIEYIYQRERLNLQTPDGDAIVQTTEETCRGEFEAVPPPRNWSVGVLWPKVIDWLRHTAGCSFYQGQCINSVVHLKSSLIDLETYDEAVAA